MPYLNFESVNYAQLSRTRKLAILLILIGEEASAALLSRFDDELIEELCYEISQIHTLDASLRKLVLEEFSQVVAEGLSCTLGGPLFLKGALQRSKGEQKAALLLSRISPTKNHVSTIEEIKEMDTRKIFNLLKNEQPQTIAFVLSNLRVQQISQVMQSFPATIQQEVLQRLGEMGMTSMEIVGRVVDSLKSHADEAQKTNLYQSGGVNQVAEVLSTFSKDQTKELLSQLEQHNPALAEAVRKRMFGFEDLASLDAAALQRIIREVEMDDLIRALKGANAAVQTAFFKCMSRRAAEDLKQEIALVSVKKKEAESAQDKIIKAARSLEEKGEITLDQDDEDTL